MTAGPCPGPVIAAGLWHEVIARAGNRCECTAECGRKHKNGGGRCIRHSSPRAPLHAVPRAPAPFHAAAAMPATALYALCDDCHTALAAQCATGHAVTPWTRSAPPNPCSRRTQMQQDPSGPAIMKAAALGYLRQGWPVFVLGRSKRPVPNCPPCRTAGPAHDRAACACLTCHGFYAATTDPARLAAMVTRIPGGLLAIRTGTASGLCVVDIDPRNGGQPDAALMTPTATVATGGGGWHLYYRHPGGPTVPALAGRAGVDIKGDGGYVAAPPSVHPGTGQPYRWAGRRPVAEMPPALRAAITPPLPAEPAPLAGPVPTRRAGGISSPPALLAAHLRAVEQAPEGRRRTTLYGAARGVARMVTAGVITPDDARAALTAAGIAAQQTERDIRAINGAFRDEGATA